MMAYKLAFDVLAGVAHGDMTPEIKHNYLVSNGIAVKVLVIALIIEAVLFLMEHNNFDTSQRNYFLGFSSFITPAIYMSLALTNSLVFALNPLTIHNVITKTIKSYFIFVAFWLSTIYLHELILNPFLFNHVPIFLSVVITVFIEFSLLILNFYIMGYIIHQNRYKLIFISPHAVDFEDGISTNSFHNVETDINPVYARVERLLSEDEIETALDIIKELYEAGDETFELKALYDEAMRLHNISDKDRYLPEVKIHKYLNKNNTNKAFSLLMEIFNADKEYKERHPEDIYSLAKYAKQSNKPQIVKKLIRNFNQKYPNHPHVVNNYFLLAQVMYEDKAQRKLVKGILQNLVKKHPNHGSINDVKSWLQGMKLMDKKER
jgi:hypothetical protein